jgi:glycerol-3-phosphate dehydrogenase
MGGPWTAGAPLPGGDFPVDGVEALIEELRERYPFLDERFARRLVRAYGTEAGDVLGDASSLDDLGQGFGWNLTEREVRWLMTREWARSAADVLWRRTKLGLRLSETEGDALDAWMRDQSATGGAEAATRVVS